MVIVFAFRLPRSHLVFGIRFDFLLEGRDGRDRGVVRIFLSVAVGVVIRFVIVVFFALCLTASRGRQNRVLRVERCRLRLRRLVIFKVLTHRTPGCHRRGDHHRVRRGLIVPTAGSRAVLFALGRDHGRGQDRLHVPLVTGRRRGVPGHAGIFFAARGHRNGGSDLAVPVVVVMVVRRRRWLTVVVMVGRRGRRHSGPVRRAMLRRRGRWLGLWNPQLMRRWLMLSRYRLQLPLMVAVALMHLLLHLMVVTGRVRCDVNSHYGWLLIVLVRRRMVVMMAHHGLLGVSTSTTTNTHNLRRCSRVGNACIGTIVLLLSLSLMKVVPTPSTWRSCGNHRWRGWNFRGWCTRFLTRGSIHGAAQCCGSWSDAASRNRRNGRKTVVSVMVMVVMSSTGVGNHRPGRRRHTYGSWDAACTARSSGYR